MRVVYAAYRNNPADPTSASGADFQFHQALLSDGMDILVTGPYLDPPHFAERAVKRLHGFISPNRYIKYNLSTTYRASKALNTVVRSFNPDVIFTMYPPAIAFFRGHQPCVLRTDTTFLGMHAQAREFLDHGIVGLSLMVWLEKLAFRKCAKIITHSRWSSQVLQQVYRIPSDRIVVFSNPAALPSHCIPETINIRRVKELKHPIRLLLVGRNYRRKGIDLAVETVVCLEQMGIPSTLTICGSIDQRINQVGNNARVRLVGYFDKSIPEELAAYTQLYREAHLLLHPARFDASPIVTSEAAAFGTPSIVNDAGGMATSVRDGESGIVLPIGSSPQLYAETIANLFKNSEHYYRLCEQTFQRYKRELNWSVAGKHVASVLREATDTYAYSQT